MRIYTLTLSPAYDVHASAKSITACHENLATVTSRDAGGKGVNISRALCSWGVSNKAVVVLGRENGQEFKDALQAQRLDCLFFEQPGRIRENLTLHPENAPETRISFTGFSVDDTLLARIRSQIIAEENTVVTFTGRVPEGIDMAAVKAFLRELKACGAKIVVDSRSFGVEDIFRVQPWLIKPNQEEISMFFGRPVETAEQAAECAKVFAQKGVENVMVSLGGDGALLLAGGKCYRAVPPKITPISTVGAGDSAVAGFMAATMEGKTAAERLRTAVAFGTAACLQAGSLPPQKADIEAIYQQISITEF